MAGKLCALKFEDEIVECVEVVFVLFSFWDCSLVSYFLSLSFLSGK